MEEKRIAALKAAEYIESNMVVGLGTGSTAFYLIEKVGEMVSKGLKLKAVATSQSTTKLAEEHGIPLVAIDEVDKIDLAIDGVDEIDSNFNAIKGGGGALFREKMVANLAHRVIWIMDSSKVVDSIGAFPLPVEILPYGHRHIIKKLEDLSLNPVLRINNESPFITDNFNCIVDLQLEKGFDIAAVSEKLQSVTGVLETGLFLNQCERIIIGTSNGARIMENNKRKDT